MFQEIPVEEEEESDVCPQKLSGLGLSKVISMFLLSLVSLLPEFFPLSFRCCLHRLFVFYLVSISLVSVSVSLSLSLVSVSLVSISFVSVSLSLSLVLVSLVSISLVSLSLSLSLVSVSLVSISLVSLSVLLSLVSVLLVSFSLVSFFLVWRIFRCLVIEGLSLSEEPRECLVDDHQNHQHCQGRFYILSFLAVSLFSCLPQPQPFSTPAFVSSQICRVIVYLDFLLLFP